MTPLSAALAQSRAQVEAHTKALKLHTEKLERMEFELGLLQQKLFPLRFKSGDVRGDNERMANRMRARGGV
jgi:hypothetical protein